MDEATARPWFVFDRTPWIGGPAGPLGSPTYDGATAGIAICGMQFRTPEEQAANARLIVQAVNAFDDLVSALDKMLHSGSPCARCYNPEADWSRECAKGECDCGCHEAIESAEAALQKVRQP